MLFFRTAEREGKIIGKGKAELLIKAWRDEKTEVWDRGRTLEQLADDIETRMRELDRDLPGALAELVEIKADYKKTKHPLEKRRLASKLIVHSKYYNYMRDSLKALQANTQRVRDAVEDSQIVFQLINNRVKDAEIYYRLNGHLKLMGKALVDARVKFPMPEVEYKNFEFTMEALEKEVSGQTDAKLIGEANEVLKMLGSSGKKKGTSGKEV